MQKYLKKVERKFNISKNRKSNMKLDIIVESKQNLHNIYQYLKFKQSHNYHELVTKNLGTIFTGITTLDTYIRYFRRFYGSQRIEN